MRTSSRLRPSPHPSPSPRHRTRCLLAPCALFASIVFAFALAPPSPAQTLAHPNWAGSGLAAESWWPYAVFYRVDPATFQDSTGDGTGDLPGLTSRLDYVAALGIDALILEPPSSPTPSTAGNPVAPPAASNANPTAAGSGPANAPSLTLDPAAFDDLQTAATRIHLRVLVALPTSLPAATLLAQARFWLTHGAAGIDLVPAPTPTASPGVNPQALSPNLLGALRAVARTFPGDRILVSELPPLAPLGSPGAPASFSAAANTSTAAAAVAPYPLNLSPSRRRTHGGSEAESSRVASAAGPQLTAFLLTPPRFGLPTEDAPDTPARPSLLYQTSASDGRTPDAVLLPSAATAATPTTAPDRTLATERLLAVQLLTLRGPVSLLYGQEIGFRTPAANAVTPPLMLWTPTNHTAPPPAPTENTPAPPPPAPLAPGVYGRFHPYVAPKPHPKPEDPNHPAPVDPDTLPGFTAGTLRTPPPADARTGNVAVEDEDPHSLLNTYRHLIALHHDNATLRSGAIFRLEPGPNGAIVWVRRAPAGVRTVASVVIACNPGSAPLTLNLDRELQRVGLHPGTLRPLLAEPSVTGRGPQSTSHLALTAGAVFVGEIYHR